MLEVSFDIMQSCAIAAAVVMVGRGIVKRVRFFQTYCIPGVIVCGLLVSLTLGLLRAKHEAIPPASFFDSFLFCSCLNNCRVSSASIHPNVINHDICSGSTFRQAGCF